jgi:hypothetical protein
MTVDIVAESGLPLDWVVQISMVCLHTRFRAFPPQHLAQHRPQPSHVQLFCATVAQSFILRALSPLLVSSIANELWRVLSR